MQVRGAGIGAAVALLLCAAESARVPLATAGAQYDKCTVEPPGDHPFIIRQDGTDHFCCQTKLTANKYAGCCFSDPVVYLPCADGTWRIRCHGLDSFGPSWAKTGTDPKTHTPCHRNAQSVVYVANGGSAAVAAPTPAESQEPRIAAIGRVAEPDDAPAVASTPERNTAPTSALGGLFPPGSDPAAKPPVLEALQEKYGGMTGTIDGVAQILDEYTRKGKAIPAQAKAVLTKAAKVMKLIANNLSRADEACGYRCLACFVKRMESPTPITSCDACDNNVLAFSSC